VLDLLKGVRVVDLGTVVLGPYATQLLADMGADVIKIEPPEGDAFRAARPGRKGGDGAGFLNLNRNKRSIVLDLGRAEDREVLHGLVASAVAFVHNMRPRSAMRRGIDYAAISAIKPDIVYCSAKGFGEGPLGDEPAYDDVIQAASGMAWLNADENGEPRFVRTVLCDKIAGLHLAFAVASGLAARERTGQGCEIALPMFEAMASFLLIEQLSGQTFEPPLPERGYGRLNAAGRRPYRTKDGFIAIMPYTAAHWQRFLRLTGRGELADADFVTDGQERSEQIETLYGLIMDVSAERTTGEWLELLREADIPCAPVNRLEELPDELHLVVNGFFRRYEHPVEGTLNYPSSPFASSTSASTPDNPPPALDADRAAIIADLDRTDQ
jgi:crotonobetainyl-CoA:carnitine CoA-transferase CaiB-like acyl-CoA transferase